MATNKEEVREFLLKMDFDEYEDLMGSVEEERYLLSNPPPPVTVNKYYPQKAEDISVGSVFTKRGPKGGVVFREVVSIDQDTLVCRKLKHNHDDNNFARTNDNVICVKSDVVKIVRNPRFE
jgi:hypothetical protein